MAFPRTGRTRKETNITAPKPVNSLDVAAASGSSYPEPFSSQMGEGDWRSLGDVFGLTQFGFNLERLEPGARSSIKHWHTLSDELVYVLEGELAVYVGAERHALTSGMCIGFKAGERHAHHLVNESTRTARYLVMGSRVPGDTAFYPDDDIAWFRTENGSVAVHKDGTPYPRRAK